MTLTASLADLVSQLVKPLAISRADCSSFARTKSSPPGQVSLCPQLRHDRLLLAKVEFAIESHDGPEPVVQVNHSAHVAM